MWTYVLIAVLTILATWLFSLGCKLSYEKGRIDERKKLLKLLDDEFIKLMMKPTDDNKPFNEFDGGLKR